MMTKCANAALTPIKTLVFSGVEPEISSLNFSSPKPSQIVKPARVKPSRLGKVDNAVPHQGSSDTLLQNGYISRVRTTEI